MKEKTIWFGPQEGGSSTEIYFHTFDSAEDAEEARENHARESYRSAEPIPVKGVEIDGKVYFEESQVIGLLEEAGYLDFEYVDYEDNDECELELL